MTEYLPAGDQHRHDPAASVAEMAGSWPEESWADETWPDETWPDETWQASPAMPALPPLLALLFARR